MGKRNNKAILLAVCLFLTLGLFGTVVYATEETQQQQDEAVCVEDVAVDDAVVDEPAAEAVEESQDIKPDLAADANVMEKAEAVEEPALKAVQADGWHKENGKTFYYENGKPVVGLNKRLDSPSGQKAIYDFNSDGSLKTSFYKKKIGKYTYTAYSDLDKGVRKDCWEVINGETYYFTPAGFREYGLADIKDNNGKVQTYYFDWTTGKLFHSGWLYLRPSQSWVYADLKTGAFKKGVQKIDDGNYYYFNSKTGAREGGFIYTAKDSNGVKQDYYFDWSTGKLHTDGWLYFSGYNRTVYTDRTTGAFLKGMKSIGSDTYYFDTTSGFRDRGIIRINQDKSGSSSNQDKTYKDYYFDWSTGKMFHNGWLYMRPYDNYVYADKRTGEFLTGHQTIGKDQYHFDKEGLSTRGLLDEGKDTYYYDWSSRKLFKDGWKYFWVYDKYAYADPAHQGRFLKGKSQINGNEFNFDKSGFTKLGWYTDGLGKHYVGKDFGTVKDGIYTIGDNQYYFINGAAQHGINTIGGNRYYFDWNTYRLYDKGWKKFSAGTYAGYYVYCDPTSNKGILDKTNNKVNGNFLVGDWTIWANSAWNKYTFDKIGRKVKGADPNRWGNYIGSYDSSTNYFIYVRDSYSNPRVYVFHRNNGGTWDLWYNWSVTTGKSSTRTPVGVYRTSGWKDLHFGEYEKYPYTAWYFTSFNRGYGFHSTIDRPYTFENTIYNNGPWLGSHLSHGCIRMAHSNAKWIYDNIPAGTTVRVVTDW